MDQIFTLLITSCLLGNVIILSLLIFKFNLGRYLVIGLIVSIIISLYSELIVVTTMNSIVSLFGTPIIIAPLAYLFLKKHGKDIQFKRGYLYHFIIPLSLIGSIYYNQFISDSENIMISILSGLLVDIIVMVYTILIFINSSIKYSSHSKGLYFFILIISVFLFVDTFVSITKILYFTNNIDLVNLSVNIPRIYSEKFYKILLAFLGGGSIYYMIRLMQTKLKAN